MDNETIEVPVKYLTKLLNVRKQHYKVCDRFKIPEEHRGENWVGDGIIERINTFQTAYSIRETMAKKDTGAAFVNPDERMKSDNIVDPSPIDKQETVV